MKQIKRFHFAALLLSLLAFGTAWTADIETEARAIEGKLMTPCCMANTVAEHHSSIALEMREEIRDMLRQGQTSDQILAHYAAKHGDQILAMPAAKGFNLVAWLVPIIFLVIGPVLVFVVLKKWASKHAAVAATAKPDAPIDPEYAKRLQARLAELD